MTLLRSTPPTSKTMVIAAAMALTLCACASRQQAESPQVLRYLSWAAARSPFSVEFVARLNAIPNVRVTTEETSSSLVVLSMLHEGRGDFGFSQADVTYIAYRRGIDGSPGPSNNLRAIAVRWVNSLLFAVAGDSPIRRVEDLRHKRVGMVPPGAAGQQMTRIVLEAHGLTFSDFEPKFVENDQMIAAVRNGALDAAILLSTPVTGLGPQLRQSALRQLSIRREVIDEVRAKYPFAKLMVESGDRGRGVETVGVDSVLVCRKDLSEPLAYQLTKEFYAQLSQAARSQPQAGLDPDQASATPIPLHPGAARFYREREILK